MARKTNGSTGYGIYSGTSPLSGSNGPWTIAMRVKLNATGGAPYFMCLGVSGGSNQSALIYGYAGAVVEFFAYGGYSGTNPRTGSSISLADTNQHHIAYRKGGSGSSTWDKFLDGTKTSINSSINFTLGTHSQMVIGAAHDGAAPSNACFAEVIIVPAALSDADLLALANGASGLHLGAKLVGGSYFPLIGRNSPETDITGGRSLTMTTPVNDTHPRVFYPRRRQALTTTLPPNGGNVAVFFPASLGMATAPGLAAGGDFTSPSLGARCQTVLPAITAAAEVAAMPLRGQAAVVTPTVTAAATVSLSSMVGESRAAATVTAGGTCEITGFSATPSFACGSSAGAIVVLPSINESGVGPGCTVTAGATVSLSPLVVSGETVPPACSVSITVAMPSLVGMGMFAAGVSAGANCELTPLAATNTPAAAPLAAGATVATSPLMATARDGWGSLTAGGTISVHPLAVTAGSVTLVGLNTTITWGGIVKLRVIGNRDFLPIGENFIVELEGLRTLAGGFDNTQTTITCAIKNSLGVNVASPQAMPYVAGSNGTYRTTWTSTLPLIDDSLYTIVVSSGNGAVQREVDKFAREHGAL